MEYEGIAETGATPGDYVECVAVADSLRGVRYNPGQKYRVVDWFGKPCVEGQRHGKKCGAGEEKWLIPFNGWGATWRKVGAQ